MNKDDIKKQMKIRLNIDDEVIEDLYKKYKEKVLDKIKYKPYILGSYITLNVNAVEKYIETSCIDKDINLHAFYIIFILNIRRKDGHVFAYEAEVEIRVKEKLNNKFKESYYNEAMSYLIERNEIVHKDRVLYLKEIHEAEELLAVRVAELNRKIVDKDVEVEIKKFLKDYKEIKLNREQKNAVKIALCSNISMIIGSAGTGKTTTIKAIVEGYKAIDSNADIKLLSFSGKAVRRIEEAVDLKAYTIHSQLSVDKSGEYKKIKANMIIVDEASMVDLLTFSKLLSALEEECKVVIVGDSKQLPSIEAGQVFKDLLLTDITKAELNIIKRQGKGSKIVSNSNKIAVGNGIIEDISIKKDEFEFYEVESKLINKKVIETIDGLLRKKVRIGDIQVISPQRGGINGTDSLNKVIASKFNLLNKEFRKDNKFMVVDPVINLKNDYKRQIFNGEKGIITEIRNDYLSSGLEIKVDFGGKEIIYKGKEELKDLELAYSLTVHKMQGSEEKVIIFVISKEFKNLNREMLYVAVTRAKERVIIIGEKEAFNNAVKRKTEERNSKLAKKINQLL